MQIEKFEAATLTIIIIFAFGTTIHSGLASLITNYTIHNSVSIGYTNASAGPLHVEGRYIKNVLGQIVYLRGGWTAALFAESCNGIFVAEGENWYVPDAVTKWRINAVNLMLDDAVSWGFNSIASFMWMDWWINDASTGLMYDINDAFTDRSYRTNIKEFLTLAEQKGIYIQLRPYGVRGSPDSANGIGFEGRVNFPFPAGAYTHDGQTIPDAQAFADWWYSVAYELAGHPNVIFNLYDEPSILDRQIWFDAANLAIGKIREAEADAGGYTHLIQPHWDFCGSCLWIEDWINQGLPTENIVFSNHIYREQGGGASDTFGPPPYPYDYDTQKAILQYRNGDPNIPEQYRSYGRAWKYIIDTYNVPIVATFGAYQGWQNDEEYQAFQNTASILNEWEVGYWIYTWYRPGTVFSIVEDTNAPFPPDRVGLVLQQAIAEGENYKPATGGTGTLEATTSFDGVSVVADITINHATTDELVVSSPDRVGQALIDAIAAGKT